MPTEIRIRGLESQVNPADLPRIERYLISVMKDLLDHWVISPQWVDEILWHAKSMKSAELIQEIEREPIRCSKEILYCVLSKQGTYSKAHLLPLHFPEISFVDVEAPTPVPDEDMQFFDLTGVAEQIARFIIGQRAWFDLGGARRRERERIWAIQEWSAARATARIVEDESDYASLLGYVALRTGLFDQVDVIRTDAGFSCLFKEAENGIRRDIGILLHSWEYAFADHPDPAEPTWRQPGNSSSKAALPEDKGELWKALAQNTGLWRSTISSVSRSELRLVDPRSWPNKLDAVGIHASNNEVRGVEKPLGWIHDLLASGLFEFRSGDGKRIKSTIATAFDLAPHVPGEGLGAKGKAEAAQKVSTQRPDTDSAKGDHSAKGKAQALAQDLLSRSRQALNEGEPILAALMALEAVRLLRGHSVTLFLDAIMALYVSEANMETRLACATHGGREPIRKRAQELDEIAGWLARNQLADKRMLRDQTVRIWLALRNIYQQAGSFDAADEILLQVHRAEYEVRWPVRSVTSDVGEDESSFFKAIKRRSRVCLNAGCFLLEKLRNARGTTGSLWRWGVWLIPPLVCAGALLRTEWAEALRLLDVLFLVSTSIAAIFWGPDIFRYPGKIRFLFLVLSAIGFAISFELFKHIDSNHVCSGVFFVLRYDWAIAAITFLGLVWILTKGPDGISWLALAIMPSRWVWAVGFSILLLASANVSAFRRVGGRPVRISIRTAAAPLSLAWTTGQMLGVNAPHAQNQSADGGTFELDKAPIAMYPLWFENVLTGWALFALGLSSIYRKATRG